MNSQSWRERPAAREQRRAVLRAGFTDVLSTGMPMRWISVRPSPIGIGAKPGGARRSVTPRMTNRKKNVSTISATKHATSVVAAGRMSAVAVGGEAAGQAEAGLAAGDHIQHGRAGDGPQTPAPPCSGTISAAGKRLPPPRARQRPPG